MAGAATYLVTGASRGLGFEFVRQLLEGDSQSVVVAGVRNPDNAAQLTELLAKHPGRVHVIKLDVSDVDSIKAAFVEATELLPSGLDYLICNAGIVASTAKASEDKLDDIQSTMKTNFLGVIATIQAALPLLRKGNKKTVVSISSSLGSLTLMSNPKEAGPWGGWVMGYKASKAALNMAMTTLAVDLRDEGFSLAALNPGWCRTDMGNSSGSQLGMVPPVDPCDSVKGMIKVMVELTPAKSGTFISWEGNTVPW